MSARRGSQKAMHALLGSLLIVQILVGIALSLTLWLLVVGAPIAVAGIVLLRSINDSESTRTTKPSARYGVLANGVVVGGGATGIAVWSHQVEPASSITTPLTALGVVGAVLVVVAVAFFIIAAN